MFNVIKNAASYKTKNVVNVNNKSAKLARKTGYDGESMKQRKTPVLGEVVCSK